MRGSRVPTNPMYGGPARSPTERRKPIRLRPVAGSMTPRLWSSMIVGIRSATHCGIEGRVCWTKPPNGCETDPVTVLRVEPSRGSKKLVEGEKSPKSVKAAVRPVSLLASRWSAARPPDVASPAVNLKLVGVERAALETSDTQVDPWGHGALTRPAPWIASAELV